MSGAGAQPHLKRALAALLTATIPGLHAFGDEVANRQKRYPEVVIAELVSDRKPFGCGRDGYAVRDTGGALTHKGRLVVQMVDLRFRISAASDETTPGSEMVTTLAAQIEDAFEVLAHGKSKQAVTDPITGEDQRVTAIRQLDRRDLPPDTTGEPFLYRKSLSFRFTQQIPYERTVDATIDRIGITDKGNDV